MKQNIVIVGGGFAGVNLAQHLSRNSNFSVTLVDKNNYNFFPPLIYQVATGFLEPSGISYPFRKLFKGKENMRFRLGELLEILPQEKKLILNDGELAYDTLVLATGTVSNYFGMQNVKDNAIPMKTIDDAINLRNTMLQMLEKASRETDPQEQQKILNIVVAGAGPTGVELSGMFAEMGRNVVGKEYPELKGLKPIIYLIDGAPVVLGPMSEKTHKDSYDALTKMGIIIKLGLQVKDYADGKVIFVNGDPIATQNLIWTAGVTALAFKGIPGTSYGRGKRLAVDAFNKVQGVENIYAIGDTCVMTADTAFDKGHPQLAQVAIQQGVNLAKNMIAAAADNPSLKPFSYYDKGTMAIIGRNKAVVDLPKPKLHFNGFFAWLMWAFVHITSLINYRNKIRTFSGWMVAYFTKDRTLRMIFRPEKQSVK